MVQVRSSWFSLIDRNPQIFVSHIFLEKADDFQNAIHRIYRLVTHPSYVTMPVVIR
jgi:predicted acyl esterase